MKLMLRIAVGLGASALAAGGTVAADLSIGEPNWPSAQATAYILSTIIENDMGYDVEIVPGSNEVIFAGMDRGKGDMDVHPNTWVPNHTHLHDQYIEDAGTVFMSSKSYAGTSGTFVPRYFVETYDISSIYDLTNPDIAGLLDRDGDGKGDLWIGASGWSSTNVELVKMRENGYSELITPTTIDENLVIAELDKYYSDEKPYALYFYSPHWLFSKYDLIQLSEPPYSDECWNMVQPKDDADWYEKSSVACAWPSTYGAIAYSARLKSEYPDVAAFLDNADITESMAAEWAYALSVDKREVQEYADDWIANNRSVVDAWLGG